MDGEREKQKRLTIGVIFVNQTGHAQTAARLQRDWGRGDPEKLPFAPFIRTHALVHLLQKGLRYHELETSLDQVCTAVGNL